MLKMLGGPCNSVEHLGKHDHDAASRWVHRAIRVKHWVMSAFKRLSISAQLVPEMLRVAVRIYVGRDRVLGKDLVDICLLARIED